MAEQFIKQIAALVRKYAPQYGIKVYSPIIAQAILESARGTSELAVNAHNYFGLKYKANVANEFYVKVGSEQNADGSYTSSVMKWCKFPDMEAGVKGYFDFISASRYANLKGVTDPETYLKNIKADGYATSLKYVDNLMAVIKQYNLTQYDTEVIVEMSKIIAIDAGHGLYTAGKRTMKALDASQTREWSLNNRIADRLEEMLAGYDCQIVRVDDTTGAKDIALADRVRTANNENADVYISIHHNAGVNGDTGGGTVVFYYSSKTERETQAQALYDAIVNRTGLVGNRSDKVVKKGFYVVKNTSMPAFLIENGFMDSKTDVPIILTTEHAEKTAQGILDFLVKEFSLAKKKGSQTTTEAQKGRIYRVQVGAYSVKANAEAMEKKLKADGYEAIIVSN